MFGVCDSADCQQTERLILPMRLTLSTKEPKRCRGGQKYSWIFLEALNFKNVKEQRGSCLFCSSVTPRLSLVAYNSTRQEIVVNHRRQTRTENLKAEISKSARILNQIISHRQNIINIGHFPNGLIYIGRASSSNFTSE